jgi:iron(III) transport system substrate-binding protein
MTMLTRRTMTKLMLAGAVGVVGSKAQAAGKVVVYTSNDSNLNRFVFEAFTKETGIEVEPVEAGSGVVFRRITSERERPLGDIVWGVSRTLLRANKALLAPYQSKNKDAVPSGFRDADGLWLGTNVHLLVILQNTKLIPADAGPKRWDDLLDPKWKGKIAFTDPANSGSAYSNLTMLAQLWGNNDAAWEKVGQLLANTKVLNRSSLVFQGVGSGEFALGMSLEYAGYQWSSNGAPVKVIYPQDGTIAQMEGVAIIKGGPNQETAKAFVDYINRKDVREMILKATFRRPTRSDVDLTALPGGMPPLSQVKLVKYDEEGWTEKRTKTLEQIKDVLQDSR